MNIKSYTFTHNLDSENDEYSIQPVKELNSSIGNEILSNTLTFANLMGFPLYGVYDSRGRLSAYGMDKDSFKKAFALKRTLKTMECEYDDQLIDIVPMDAHVFERLHKDENTGLQVCMAQLTIFPNDKVINAKCRHRVETYIIPKVALELARECIVEPQKSVAEYRVDGVFVIRDPSIENMPNICLEIDEDGHQKYDARKEQEREHFIRSFGHRIIRRSVKRSATDDELKQEINTIVKAIRLMVRDLKCEYAWELSEEDFIREIEKRNNIDIHFARFFAKKSDGRFGQFKYNHEDIAEFLGYERSNGERGSTTRSLKDLIRQVLTENMHYIVDDGTLAVDRQRCYSPRTIKKGVKLNYWITRVGLYSICMASSKPKALNYRHQFGEVYEFSINYLQNLKNRVVKQMPDPRASERSILNRIDLKAQHTMERSAASKYKKECAVLTEMCNELRCQLEEQEKATASKERTITDLCKKNRHLTELEQENQILRERMSMMLFLECTRKMDKLSEQISDIKRWFENATQHKP